MRGAGLTTLTIGTSREDLQRCRCSNAGLDRPRTAEDGAHTRGARGRRKTGAERVSYLNLEHRVRRVRKRVGELEWWVARQTLPLDRWTINGKAHGLGQPWPSLEGIFAFAHPPVDVPDGLAGRAHAPQTRSRRRGLARRQGSRRRGDEVRPRSVPHELSTSRPPLLDHRRLRCASAVRCAEPRGAFGACRDRVDRDRSRGFHSARSRR